MVNFSFSTICETENIFMGAPFWDFFKLKNIKWEKIPWKGVIFDFNGFFFFDFFVNLIFS